MKTTLLLSLLLLPCLLPAEVPVRVLAPVESRPKVIDGLEFSVVTQSDWRNPAHRIHSSESVILQLRITNRTQHALLFPTFDSFSVKLTTAGGAMVNLNGGRDETRITPNILLQPGGSFSMPVEATLDYKEKDGSVNLIVKDGTGTIESAALPTGSYEVSFSVCPTHHDFGKRAKLPAPLWAGKGNTESVGFKVNPP